MELGIIIISLIIAIAVLRSLWKRAKGYDEILPLRIQLLKISRPEEMRSYLVRDAEQKRFLRVTFCYVGRGDAQRAFRKAAHAFPDVTFDRISNSRWSGRATGYLLFDDNQYIKIDDKLRRLGILAELRPQIYRQTGHATA